MEENKNGKLLLTLMIVLTVILFAGIGVILYFLLSGGSNQPTKIDAPIVSQTSSPIPSETTAPETKTPEKETLPPYIEGEPVSTESVPETTAPIETPSATEATTTPTPAPTALPDSFTFGGVTINRGATVINGDETVNGKIINGDGHGHFTHITKDEAELLVLMCPDLERLDLDYCWFDTYEPLSKLTNLTYLEIKSCGTDDGGVQMTDIEWVRPLVNLAHLNLCHNLISDVTPIEGLSLLEWLNLGDNCINDEGVESVSKLPNLTELYLYRNVISDISPLAVLDKVFLLNISNNKGIETVEPLTAMKKLSDLRMAGTSVDDLSYFPEFKELTIVNLSGCPLTFSDYYDNLPQCPKLKKFRIAKTDKDGILAGDAIQKDGYKLDYEIT